MGKRDVETLFPNPLSLLTVFGGMWSREALGFWVVLHLDQHDVPA